MSPSAEELRALPVFASLSAAELDAATACFTVRSYQRNAIVATEGDRLEFFYLILSGSVQAFWRDAEGHQIKLGIDAPGAHFPDVTLTGEPALVSHIALSDLRLACIRLNDLRALMQRHPLIAEVLLMDVVARLRRMIQRSKMLAMEDVYGRVVKVLLAQAADAGGELVAERLTHAEIGQQVGATREMVGRVLRQLAKGGYIRAERDRVVILRKPPPRW
jgi:CRP/FNR family transcriptional regulator, cyclic AMP receptor protein